MPSAWEPSILRDLHLQRKMARDKAMCRRVPGIESARQPDAVARVFEMNVKEMVKFLKEHKPLGDIVAALIHYACYPVLPRLKASHVNSRL
nr:hypothetical protein [Tanacetum cinerariifolium]